MAKSNILFDKTFFIVSSILLIVIAGGIFYYFGHSNSATIAVVEFNDKKLAITAEEYAQIQSAADLSNVTLNKTLVIERLAQFKVLDEQANILKIVPTREQIDAAFTQQIAVLEQQGLTRALIEQNISRAEYDAMLKSRLAQELKLQLLFNQEVVSKLQIEDQELVAFYTANPSQFLIPESVAVKHILVCYEGAVQCALNLTKEQAQQSILALYQALQQNSSFESLASQYSTDTGSAQRGGDIGQIAKGQTVPEFETVAFETPVGQYSVPFETAYGYHILAVYGKQAAQQLSLEQAAPAIRQQLILQQANVLQQAYINGLMASATITMVG